MDTATSSEGSMDPMQGCPPGFEGNFGQIVTSQHGEFKQKSLDYKRCRGGWKENR